MNGVRRLAVRVVTTAVALIGLVLPGSAFAVSSAPNTFPGTNGRILYFGTVHKVFQVFSINPDGSGKTQLTHLPKGADVATATADGSTIAFSSGGHIWVMNADGSGRTRLTSGHFDFYPAISPDGQRIAFERLDGDVLGLVVMNADGSAQRTIVRRKQFQTNAPDWSPDGTRLAFTLQTWDLETAHIYTIKPNGKDMTRVHIAFSPDTIEQAKGASWSPDGSMFAFFAQPVLGGEPTCRTQEEYECQDLYTVSSAGGVPTRLTHDRMDDYFPIWSPDGAQITYSHDSTVGGCRLFESECRFDVFAMNADGTGVRRIVGGPLRDEEPVWWMVG